MDDYIDREAAKKFFLDLDDSFAPFSALFTPEEVVGYLGEIPAADVAPVRHGRWMNTSSMYGVISGRCSECGLASGMWHINQPYRFCPYCGAKMDLEGEQ